ncbi:hypothetical protein GCM10010228_55660 [Streptomyces massasporeus]|nr:hypothetical protein GCM10010228_55660 [Streptomyces massasporeus]
MSLTVEPGVVTGILEPNHAGRSTTMRLMLRLDRGEGRTTFGGRTYAELEQPVRTVGALPDAGTAHEPGTRRVGAGSAVEAAGAYRLDAAKAERLHADDRPSWATWRMGSNRLHSSIPEGRCSPSPSWCWYRELWALPTPADHRGRPRSGSSAADP